MAVIVDEYTRVDWLSHQEPHAKSYADEAEYVGRKYTVTHSVYGVACRLTRFTP